MGKRDSKRAVGYKLTADERVGEGFLSLRQLRLRVTFDDGTLSREGQWDFVERSLGRDAVVLALYARRGGRIEVLLRESLRVPLVFGRMAGPAAEGLYPGRPIAELVAGILEEGEEHVDGIRRRAVVEALEEAGLSLAPERVVLLGAPMWASPGVFAERFVFVACEVDDPSLAAIPEGDGSPFEEGAALIWLPLDEAIARSTRGELDDLKTELGLRRLEDYLENWETSEGNESRHRASK
jgi:8-oxo-dGTP pyrophosphatase MutT (NUDIX family)